ncbi:MAG: PQQ-binding-like beta-propeller repeat protein [Candidatus Omnitrophota bacterium]
MKWEIVYPPPVIAGNKVFVSSTKDKKFYALDEETGELIWSYDLGGHMSTCPAVAYGKVFFGSNDHKLYALDMETGKLIWTYQAGDGIYSSPAVAYGKVFFSSDDHIFCVLDEETGELIWSYKTEGSEPSQYEGGEVLISSPAVSGGKVFFGSNDQDSRLYVLDMETGELIWSYETGGGGVNSSPCVADGQVFFISGNVNYTHSDNNLYSLDAETGDFIWSYDSERFFLSSPTVSGGKVFVNSYGNEVYALNAQTGDFIWSSQGESSPVIAGGKVFIAKSIGINNLFFLDEESGEFIWGCQIGNGVYAPASLAIADGKVFFGSPDGKVCAFGSFIFSVQATPHSTWAEIDWQTRQASTSQIEYGTTANYGTIIEDYNLDSLHHIELYGLAPDTKYYFKIHSFTAENEEYIYAGDFTTAGIPEIRLNTVNASWQDEINRMLKLDISFKNIGTGLAKETEVRMIKMGSGITFSEPVTFPIDLADIEVDNTGEIELYLNIPADVNVFIMRGRLRFKDTIGDIYTSPVGRKIRVP